MVKVNKELEGLFEKLMLIKRDIWNLSTFQTKRYQELRKEELIIKNKIQNIIGYKLY